MKILYYQVINGNKWAITKEITENGYKIGLTADNLIKSAFKIHSDYIEQIEPHEIPKELYKKYCCYYQ